MAKRYRATIMGRTRRASHSGRSKITIIRDGGGAEKRRQYCAGAQYGQEQRGAEIGRFDVKPAACPDARAPGCCVYENIQLDPTYNERHTTYS